MAEALAAAAPLFSGVLYKQADVIKSWRKRWIVLHPTSITYYESEPANADGARRSQQNHVATFATFLVLFCHSFL